MSARMAATWSRSSRESTSRWDRFSESADSCSLRAACLSPMARMSSAVQVYSRSASLHKEPSRRPTLSCKLCTGQRKDSRASSSVSVSALDAASTS